MEEKTNIIRQRFLTMYNNGTQEQKEYYDYYSENNITPFEFQKIKTYKPKPKTGDVFLFKVKDDMYFYGKILNADLRAKANASWAKESVVILLFKIMSKNIELPKVELSIDRLFSDTPYIVTKDGWEEGYFYTIANQELTDDEKNLDYGFYKYSFVGSDYVDEYGSPISKPHYIGGYGAGSWQQVQNKVQKDFIFDNDIFGNDHAVSSLIVSRNNDTVTEKKYIDIVHDKKCSYVIVDCQHEMSRKLSSLLEEINTKAYLNGYAWENILRCYISKHLKGIEHSISHDPETSAYIALFKAKDAEHAKILFEHVEIFYKNPDELIKFIKENDKNINWDG